MNATHQALGETSLKNLAEWLTQRVYSSSKYEGFPRYWYEIPLIAKYVNRKITGSEEPFYDWLKRKYAMPPFRRGLSVGCGFGAIEREFWRNQICQQMDCFDISPRAISQARELTLREIGANSPLRFLEGNVCNYALPAASYDFVLFWASLHHFNNLKDVLSRAGDILFPGGICLVYEFIGPSRFQWPQKQLALVNALLKYIPEEWRKISHRDIPKLIYSLLTLQVIYSFRLKTFIKRKVTRPSKLAMWWRDPSEAICSAEIPAALQSSQHFEILEERPFGGTLLHLLLVDIYSNYLEEDQRQELLRILISLEESLLGSSLLPSDFCVYVLRKKSA